MMSTFFLHGFSLGTLSGWLYLEPQVWCLLFDMHLLKSLQRQESYSHGRFWVEQDVAGGTFPYYLGFLFDYEERWFILWVLQWYLHWVVIFFSSDRVVLQFVESFVIVAPHSYHYLLYPWLTLQADHVFLHDYAEIHFLAALLGTKRWLIACR